LAQSPKKGIQLLLTEIAHYTTELRTHQNWQGAGTKKGASTAPFFHIFNMSKYQDIDAVLFSQDKLFS
jgi:hypothetical protein